MRRIFLAVVMIALLNSLYANSVHRMQCSFVNEYKQKKLRLCAYECENGDYYVMTFKVKYECELIIELKDIFIYLDQPPVDSQPQHQDGSPSAIYQEPLHRNTAYHHG